MNNKFESAEDGAYWVRNNCECLSDYNFSPDRNGKTIMTDNFRGDDGTIYQVRWTFDTEIVKATENLEDLPYDNGTDILLNWNEYEDEVEEMIEE
ncbi:MAG: hypothetical protein RSD95_03725 [Clostridia bacterium]